MLFRKLVDHVYKNDTSYIYMYNYNMYIYMDNYKVSNNKCALSIVLIKLMQGAYIVRKRAG